MKFCAYCRAAGTMTKEHLWPASLHRRLQEVRGDKKHLFYLRKLDTEIKSEPTIRDVCETCNNVTLSKLDSYICELFETNFRLVPRRGDIVRLSYDYDRLLRWLLKISFNSARVNEAFDRAVFEPLLSYIIGQTKDARQSMRVFVELQYPCEVPPDETDPDFPPGTLFEPLLNRLGHVQFHSKDGTGRKVLRAVHLCAYSFLIAFFRAGAPQSEKKDLVETFLWQHPKSRLLDPKREWIDLESGGMGAWDSLRGSRSKSVAGRS